MPLYHNAGKCGIKGSDKWCCDYCNGKLQYHPGDLILQCLSNKWHGTFFFYIFRCVMKIPLCWKLTSLPERVTDSKCGPSRTKVIFSLSKQSSCGSYFWNCWIISTIMNIQCFYLLFNCPVISKPRCTSSPAVLYAWRLHGTRKGISYFTVRPPHWDKPACVQKGTWDANINFRYIVTCVQKCANAYKM